MKATRRILSVVFALVVVILVVDLTWGALEEINDAEQAKLAAQDLRRDIRDLKRHHPLDCANEISRANWHLDEFNDGTVDFVGEVRNNCASPLGIQLRAVFRDASGNIVTTEEFWPASTRNIAPGSSYPFSSKSYPGMSAARVKSLELSVIDVQEWK